MPELNKVSKAMVDPNFTQGIQEHMDDPNKHVEAIEQKRRIFIQSDEPVGMVEDDVWIEV